MRRSAPIAALCAALIAVSGCGQSGHHDEHDHEPDEASHAERKEAHAERIHLTESTQEAVGLRIVSAEVKPLERILEVTGQVAQDTDRFVHVHPPHAGIVSDLTVTVGTQVARDDVLAIVKSKDGQAAIEVRAPLAGLVIGIHTSRGAMVDTLTSLMTVADLSQVWATFDFYEQDAGVVGVGQRIDVYSVAYPDQPFTGEVIFVSPQVDQHTRMIKVRAQVENPAYALKLGMFVTGRLYIPTVDDALVVPLTAIQRVEAERMVFVQVGAEEFEAREVRVGSETPLQAQILAGLEPGERVVAEGSFHLKAELLKGTLEEGHAH